MSVVIYTNPKNGCKYAYESVYEWSEEHQQSRPKRKYLGKVDEDGNIIYSTHKRGGFRQKSKKTLEKEKAADEGAVTITEGEEKYRKMYEHVEKDRQACMKRIHELEVQVSDLERSLKALQELLGSIQSMASTAANL